MNENRQIKTEKRKSNMKKKKKKGKLKNSQDHELHTSNPPLS